MMLKITDDMAEISQYPKAIVYFSAEWCQPCKALKPQYAKLALSDPDHDYFVVDVDKIGSAYVDKYSIASIPQILVVESGEFVKKLSGRNFQDLSDEVKSI